MSILFKAPEWESNSIADKTCNETFKKTQKLSSKTKNRNQKKVKPNLEKASKVIKKAKNRHSSNKKAVKHIKDNNKTILTSKDIVIKSKKIKNPKKTPNINQKRNEDSKDKQEKDNSTVDDSEKEKNRLNKFKRKLAQSLEGSNDNFKSDKKKSFKNSTLRERMIEKLKAARFRYLNEELYTKDSNEAEKVFNSDVDSFKAYHDGYRQQVQRWPLNPLDKIVAAIKKMPQNFIVADFGCGEAKLAASVPQKVHSFDLVALNPNVTVCNMAHCPLGNSSVDVIVFCLSLMGTNLQDFLSEANRVLKIGGILKIAEVESRFDNIDTFIQGVEKFHFKNTWKDLSHQLFYFLDFKKMSNIKKKHKLPSVSLQPCMYKKR